MMSRDAAAAVAVAVAVAAAALVAPFFVFAVALVAPPFVVAVVQLLPKAVLSTCRRFLCQIPPLRTKQVRRELTYQCSTRSSYQLCHERPQRHTSLSCR